MAKNEDNEVKETEVKTGEVSDEELKRLAEIIPDEKEEDADIPVVAEESNEEFEENVKAQVKSFAEQIDRMFAKRRVHMATPEEQKELYKEDKDTVVDRTGETLTEKQKKKIAVKHLVQAARSLPVPTILTGEVTRVQELDGRWWLVSEEILPDGTRQQDIPIKIPVSQFWKYNAKDYEGEAGHEYLHKECKRRIRAKIRFIVYDVDEKNGFAIGSRLAALERDGIANYYKLQSDGLPKFCDGMKVPARVVGTLKDRVRIEVRGADVTISNRDLAWTALEALDREFHTGDTFMVKISNIHFVTYEADGRKYKLAELNASRKDAMENPADRWYDTFNVGDTVSGVIKSEADAQGVFVCLEGKMDALCSNPVHGIPMKGMKCIVQIKRKQDDTKRISGIIVDMG